MVWLPLGVILAVIARVYVIFRTPRGFVPRKRAQTETCHLAVFLGSGKLHTVRSSHPQQHPMLTRYVFLSSRWTQQRSSGSRICSGLFAIHTEDVHSKRGRPPQRTEGRRVGAAQSNHLLIFRSQRVIAPRKCRSFYLLSHLPGISADPLSQLLAYIQ